MADRFREFAPNEYSSVLLQCGDPAESCQSKCWVVIIKGQLGYLNFGVLFAVLLSWIIVYICIRKGTEQTGKIAVFTVLTPYVLLFIFLIR